MMAWLHGFTTGGVNLGSVEDCQIDGNTFTDCYGAAHIRHRIS